MTEKVDHPKHYNSHPSGIECIEITRHHDFLVGSVFKYLWREGLKEGESSLDDLKKARWYLEDKIKQVEAQEAKRFGQDYHLGDPVPLQGRIQFAAKKTAAELEIGDEVVWAGRDECFPAKLISKVPLGGDGNRFSLKFEVSDIGLEYSVRVRVPGADIYEMWET
jgi:Protein of unknwon function (DUF3310)